MKTTANPVTKTALQVELRSPKKFMPIAELQRVEEQGAVLGQTVQVMVVVGGQMYQVAQGIVESLTIDNEVSFDQFGVQKTLKPISRQAIRIVVRS